MLFGRVVRYLGLFLALTTLFFLGVYFFFPSQRIEYEIMRRLEAQRLSISPGLHKTVVPGLMWDKPVISSDQGALVRSDWLRIQPRVWPLLRGRLLLKVKAVLGDGQLDADYGVNGTQALMLQATDIKLGDLPFFRSVLGARAGGILWSKGHLARDAQGLNGELKLEIKQLELSGVRLGAFPLPDVSGLQSQGMLRVTGNKARLESFTLQGTGIYMRLSGDVPLGTATMNVPLNLTLEIMPKPEFLESQKLVFLVLSKFMVSPGVYRVPIRGTLLKPEIM
jgi:type II secretion system protein N